MKIPPARQLFLSHAVTFFFLNRHPREMSLTDFRHMVLPIKNKLFRFALSIVGDTAEAQDIVQEVLIKIWNQREEWPRIQNMEAWCMRLTKNLSIDKLRSRHNRTDSIEQAYYLSEHTTDPYQKTEYEDTLAAVKRLMDQLPERQKLVMQLRDIEGMTYEEISQAIDMPLSQVKINLFRARKQIRTNLIKSESYGL
jgi:RNA polymerase sigma factor (sigma-70 family)